VGRHPIELLPPEVIERIAAGEVIERPASTARELIANALDAAATDIRIEIQDGGIRLLRVADDGCGIAPDQLALACQPHMTSKLHALADLDAITTLGFRGEALASIAAVAELELLSAADDGGLATGLLLRMDAEPERTIAARPRGTTVMVRDLFANVPARKSMLRGPHREAAKVIAVVRAYALSHPAVRFTLVDDGRLMLRTPGAALPDAVTALYGSDAAHAMLTFTTRIDSATIEGCISARAVSQANREHVIIAINRRPVANRALLYAAEAGYRPLLRKGRHPLLVVNVTIAPALVDASVHPAKAEVLVRNELEIAARLRETIHQTLGSAPASIAPSAARPAGIRAAQPIQLRLPRTLSRRRGARARALPPWLPSETYGGDLPATIGSAALTRIGQFDDVLLLAEGPDGSLYLVDQHRAHERILYDRLRAETLGSAQSDGMSVDSGYRKQGDAPASSSQLLLEPVLVELTPRQADVLSWRLDELASIGIECQPFGGSTFLVRALPTPIGAAQQPSAFAADLARHAAEDSDDWLDHVRISLACRCAIRRGQALSPSDQDALLLELRQVSAPAACPHGSPLMIRYSREQMARLFDW
jgi:DNA mismatch repair protein MutL